MPGPKTALRETLGKWPPEMAHPYIDGFHVTYCFDFYVQRPDFLEAKTGRRQWKDLEKTSKEKKNHFFRYLIVLPKKY